MNPRIVKWMVLSLSLLTAYLITTYIDDLMLSYQNELSPVWFTWVGMIVIVAIFFPLFAYIDTWTDKFTRSLMRSGKSLFGKKLGVVIVFLVAVLLLYFLFGKMWFNRNVFIDFFSIFRT